MRHEVHDLGPLFSPRSVAVVGASNSRVFAPGRRYVQALLSSGFKGAVYPVNTSGSEVLGLTAYTSIVDIPGPVDQVICCIPASRTPQLVKDCVAKGVRLITLFNSGFTEIGSQEGAELEREVLDIACSGGVHVLGPNCMGLLSTDSGLAFFTFEAATATGGPLAFISQSGGYAQEMVSRAVARGLGVSKVVSYGNAADLDETDFLRYLAQDEASEMIGIYIEGVKAGRRFVQALRGAAAAKPVILLKGGTTSAGTRAVGSHTGALAGSTEVWNALCAQTGAMQVGNLDELVDLALLLKYSALPQGRRVGILTFGGGRGVRSADECESVGLTVPQLPDKVRRQLADFTPRAGTSVRNPVDSTAVVALNVELFSRTTELIIDSGVIDILVVYLFVEFMYPELPHLLEEHVEAAAETARRYKKPVAVVLSTTGDRLTAGLASRGTHAAMRAGVPAYPSIGGAAAALSRFVAHHESRGLGSGLGRPRMG